MAEARAVVLESEFKVFLNFKALSGLKRMLFENGVQLLIMADILGIFSLATGLFRF